MAFSCPSAFVPHPEGKLHDRSQQRDSLYAQKTRVTYPRPCVDGGRSDLQAQVVLFLFASVLPETGQASHTPGRLHASVTLQTHAFDQAFRPFPRILVCLSQHLRQQTLGLQFDIARRHWPVTPGRPILSRSGSAWRHRVPYAPYFLRTPFETHRFDTAGQPLFL